MKKLLSVLLVAVLLVSSLSVLSFAAPASTASYTVTGSYAVPSNTKAQKELFAIDLTIDASKVYALDGESTDYTYEIDSIIANDIDYVTDEDAFFAAFTSEDYSGTVLDVTFTINFESEKVFGELNYNIDVTGFMAPYSVGLGPVDDALANVSLPVEVTFADTIWQFPTIDEIEVIQAPTKQEYTDVEKFSFDGTVIAVNTKVATDYEEIPNASGVLEKVYTYEEGIEGIVEYNEDTAYMFTANPSESERLNVNATEVVAYMGGVQIAKLPIKVTHSWASGYSNITTGLWTEGNPGYHAILCDGCGEAHDAQPHNLAPVLDENGEPLYDDEGNEVYWTSNNDQSFIEDGTESAKCIDCGAVVTRTAHGTADFNNGSFADLGFISTILNLISIVLNLIGSIGG